MLYQKLEQKISNLKPDNTYIANNTLVLIRWVALIGQCIAIFTTHYVFDIELERTAISMVLLCSVMVNIGITFMHGRKQLTAHMALIYLCYDALQLSLMLFLTGGLQNPFSIMLLAPLTVGASRLPLVQTSILTCVTLLCSIFLYYASMPLVWPGNAPSFPALFLAGEWLAIGITTLFIAAFVWKTAHESRKMSAALLSTRDALMAQQKMYELGTQAAAAAHELGSPLSTIAIIVKDLEHEFANDEHLKEDIALLCSQTERCRKILADLSHNFETPKEELTPPLNMDALIELISEPYRKEHPEISITYTYEGDANKDKQPQFHKTPELSHGLGNILNNAVQFAQTDIHVTISGDDKHFRVTITDDGPGFPASVLNKIGEPYISTRKDQNGHMGLGLFIAKSLLEYTGAQLQIKNAKDETGAIAEIIWPYKAIENAGKSA